MQEIVAKHIIYRPRKKNQNNQLKKVNVVASGKEEFSDDKKKGLQFLNQTHIKLSRSLYAFFFRWKSKNKRSGI